MKNTVRFLLPVLCTAMVFASCSIEKRHYRPGYHIEWKSGALFQHRVKTVPPVETVESKAEMTVNAVDDQPQLKTEKISDRIIVPTEPIQVVQHTTKPPVKIPAKTGHHKTLSGKKIERLIPFEKITPLISSPKISDMALGDDGRLIIGIILLIFGLSPFAVLVYNGAGPEFSLDFLLWILGLVFLIIGFASGSPALVAVGWILLVVAFIYAIIAMIRRAV